MTVFISGGAKNGKSTLAQDLAVRLSGSKKRYYVATMLSSGPEDDERIRRHIADRAHLGFETIECFRDILSIADLDGTFLVDSVTALIQNALFPVEKHYEMDTAAVEKCVDDLVAFAASVQNAVFVSDYIYSDAQHYDEGTETYRKCLASVDRRLAASCDTVVEVAAGQYTVHKGALLL